MVPTFLPSVVLLVAHIVPVADPPSSSRLSFSLSPLFTVFAGATAFRQTLCGADYGLLDEATLSPTPEYWVSVLWKRLMGCDVYEVTCEPKPPPSLRLYCHGIQNEDYRTYLIINLDENEVELDFGMSRWYVAVWIVQGESPASQTLTINGKTPLATKDGKLPSLLPRSNLFGPVRVPAGAAAFVEVEMA